MTSVRQRDPMNIHSWNLSGLWSSYMLSHDYFSTVKTMLSNILFAGEVHV